MYLIETAPLTKIPIQNPQILSYFSAHDLLVGSLILTPLGKRLQEAIVIETHEIKNHKMEIKEAGYELRPIKKILNKIPILTQNQIKLALWLGQYYFASPGIFLKMMMPKSGIKNYDLRIKNKSEQILILVPTITQVAFVAKNYREDKTVLIHSGLKLKRLNENWQKIASGEALIIIGTRLAVFAPFTNLKEIIIKDETNSSHRSFDMFPHYRTHEIAKKLAELFGAKLKFESNLPSLESPNSPIFLISPTLIDLRQEIREGNYTIFSRALQDAIKKTLAQKLYPEHSQKEQVILFINRRGAATFVLCRDCGYVAKCPNCDTPLTYHLLRLFRSDLNSASTTPILVCHHCGQKEQPPSLCPKCQGHRIKAFGSGTQRVEYEAQKLFKDAKILRLDSDTAPTPADQQKIIKLFREKKADILIGTQMMLNADLPRVALVAMISADTLLHLPDFRSDERLFQTITALNKFLNPPPFYKGGLGGILTQNFFIQTYNPKNKTLALAAQNNWQEFYEKELETRKILNYPPFSQLIKLVFRHRDPKKAAQEAKILSAKLTQQLKTSTILNEVIFSVSDAIPSFISKQKGKYVWQIIIKAKSYWLASVDQRENLLKLRNKILLTAGSNWEIEVDPESLL
ncbi:MAG: primosomal protein N' [Candidatus Portnoybacteria bacterium RBG_13_41_18]|uniref:Probable replication restart protein PriA n=1 Tax=Candidatus Portnoybacteria bacterium RBG_13_41_18 TaxID=1801991 RepID=A0A1G2F8W1_9BACT|nr:MAG: primosomal protein N' [Candidatus Portnoybacteria bacterium RBG_13_41_18]